MHQLAEPSGGAAVEVDAWWRNWLARGAERDRRTAKRMRGLALLIAAGLLVLFVLQLA
jgi:hypothetical protein